MAYQIVVKRINRINAETKATSKPYLDNKAIKLPSVTPTPPGKNDNASIRTAENAT